MSGTLFTKSEFLLLRSETDKLARELMNESLDKLILPEEKGGDTDIETVSVGALFLTTLTAVARAKRKLQGSDIAIDMGSEPLEMKFTGTITGITDNDILMELIN